MVICDFVGQCVVGLGSAHDQVNLEGCRDNLAAVVRHDPGAAAAAEHVGRPGPL